MVNNLKLLFFNEPYIKTLLNYILQNKQGLKVAVIVNDMSEVNIDVELVKQTSTLSRTEEKMVEMTVRFLLSISKKF